MAHAHTPPSNLPLTIGTLRASGWQSFPVKEELRRNAVKRIAAGLPLFEGVLGYEDTVTWSGKDAHHSLAHWFVG